MSGYTENEIGYAKALARNIADLGLSQAQVARKVEISATALNLVLSGKYASPPGKMLNRIDAALARFRRKNTPEVVETSMFKLVRQAGNKACRDRCVSVVTGAVGTGKTVAIKNAFDRACIIEADPVMHVGVFIDELARKLGLRIHGTIPDKMARIVEKLEGARSLLIVDEAETLKPKVLETARRIHDKAEIGMLLTGTGRLLTLLTPREGHFGQIRSRVAFWPKHIDRISADDEKLIIDAYLPEADASARSEIRKTAQGSVRMLRKGLIMNIRNWGARNPGKCINAAVVRAIADQAMSL